MRPHTALWLGALLCTTGLPIVNSKKQAKASKPSKKPKQWGGPILSRCSACSAVADEILTKQEKVAKSGREMTELQAIELLEDERLGHLCNRMKINWHYVTM